MQNLELVSYGNPDAGEAMTLAHELREEDPGLDMSEALSRGWDIVRGAPWDDDDYEDEEDEEMVFDEIVPQSRRRASNATDADSGIGVMLLLGVGGYLAWCYFTSSYKNLPWSWAPWKTAPLSRRLARPVIRPGQQLTPAPMYRSPNGYEQVTLIVP